MGIGAPSPITQPLPLVCSLCCSISDALVICNDFKPCCSVKICAQSSCPQAIRPGAVCRNISADNDRSAEGERPTAERNGQVGQTGAGCRHKHRQPSASHENVVASIRTEEERRKSASLPYRQTRPSLEPRPQGTLGYVFVEHAVVRPCYARHLPSERRRRERRKREGGRRG